MSENLLESILENNLKTKIIGLLLASPERSFYLGELEKRLSSKALAPHLSFFVKTGLLMTFTKKEKRYYLVNKKNPFLNDLRLSVSKTFKNYEDELVRNMKKIPNLKVGVLCGIFCADTETDCDILLAGDISEKALSNFIAGAEKIMGLELNYAVFETKEYEYRKSIFDRFMKDIFENPHIVIVNKLK
ncbi:MAG: hypothetical protein JWO40_720 [Candidatus Doudnabacteria bacterium]|nr:hypothetical protein [Candidatus Doudnabacteria bacterium]